MKYIQYKKYKSMIVVFLMTIMAAEAQQQAEPVQEVAVITINEEAALIRLLLGSVYAPKTQTISSQVSGVITSERIGMGQRVTKGDVIAQLDDRDANAQYALAQAEIAIAKTKVRQFQLNFERVNNTFNKKLSSRAESDEAALLLERAKNELKAYEARGLLAQLHVEKHHIVAPFDGLLITNTPVVGKQLSPGATVVEMLDNSQLRVKVRLSQPEMMLLLQYQAQVVLGSDNALSLKLLEASPVANTKSGMIEAEFELSASAGAVSYYSGQALTVQLVEDRISVPERAIAEDFQGRFVYVVNDSKVTRVAIDDLSIGQEVIVLGPAKLNFGDRVSVLPVGNIQ